VFILEPSIVFVILLDGIFYGGYMLGSAQQVPRILKIDLTEIS